MRIFIFKSAGKKELRAFAADEAGSALPEKHRPWTVTGTISPQGVQRHRMSRKTVEGAIATHGFQLWRLTKVDAGFFFQAEDGIRDRRAQCTSIRLDKSSSCSRVGCNQRRKAATKYVESDLPRTAIPRIRS